MATDHKKEKRKIRKQQKRQKRLKELHEKQIKEQIKIDILNILKTELYDTKPNMAKLLETYVKTIRLYISNNIYTYPSFHYDVSKIFVRFCDDSELLRLNVDNKFDYILTRDYKDIKLNEKEKELVEKFFSLLIQFKFIKLSD